MFKYEWIKSIKLWTLVIAIFATSFTILILILKLTFPKEIFVRVEIWYLILVYLMKATAYWLKIYREYGKTAKYIGKDKKDIGLKVTKWGAGIFVIIMTFATIIFVILSIVLWFIFVLDLEALKIISTVMKLEFAIEAFFAYIVLFWIAAYKRVGE